MCGSLDTAHTCAIAVMLCYNDFRFASLHRLTIPQRYLHHSKNTENRFPAACASTENSHENPINYIKPLCAQVHGTLLFRLTLSHTQTHTHRKAV